MYMDLFSKLKKKEGILLVVFAIYLIGNFRLPDILNDMIDNTIGNIVIVIFALALFLNSSPLVGIVGFLVAYELIRRANTDTGSEAIVKFLPSEENKEKKMKSYQPSTTQEITLEEEMIHNMKEFTDKENNEVADTNVQPVLGNNYGATSL